MAHILVVEDDPTSALIVEHVLSRMGGHEVTVTEDAEQVLSLCAQGRVEFVLMDVSLTNTSYQGTPIDGVRLTQLLRQGEHGDDLPVLLLTAHAMRGDRERLLQDSGANGYLAKPILDHNELVETIEGMLRDSSARRAA